MDYLWLKAAHVAAVLVFTGGLFVQSFGIASGARDGSDALCLVARWDRRVTLPAMLLVWLSGALVASAGSWFSSPWLWTKLALVVALTGLHGVQAGKLRKLRAAQRVEAAVRPLLVPGCIAAALTVVAVLAVTKPSI